jgi:hypothetical protein
LDRCRNPAYFKFDHETWTASRTALIQLILASFRESRPSFGHLLQLLSVSGRSRPCHVSAFCGVAKVVLDFFHQRFSRKASPIINGRERFGGSRRILGAPSAALFCSATEIDLNYKNFCRTSNPPLKSEDPQPSRLPPGAK